jgi:hypothetical protein
MSDDLKPADVEGAPRPVELSSLFAAFTTDLEVAPGKVLLEWLQNHMSREWEFRDFYQAAYREALQVCRDHYEVRDEAAALAGLEEYFAEAWAAFLNAIWAGGREEGAALGALPRRTTAELREQVAAIQAELAWRGER